MTNSLHESLTCVPIRMFVVFFFNDTATTEIYTLSLHDALPISVRDRQMGDDPRRPDRDPRGGLALDLRSRFTRAGARGAGGIGDRKSTRLNSSHGYISYAVFCMKKKIITTMMTGVR